MNPFTLLLSEIVYRPIFNLLIVFLAVFQGNMGLSIIALTLTIRLLLLKSSFAQNDMQKQMTDLQPKLHEIQERYKDNPEKMSEETMKVLKTHGGGPLKGCIMMLIQLPIFIGLFYVIKDFSNTKLSTLIDNSLYSFLHFVPNGLLNANNINHMFLGIDLLKSNHIIIAAVAGVLIYIQMKLTMMNQPAKAATPSMPGMPAMPDMTKMMGIMNIFMVFMMISFVYSMPAGIGIYILTTTLFSIVQYCIQYKELIKVKLIVLFKKSQ